MAFRNTD